MSVNSTEKKSRPAAVALIGLLVTMALRPTGCDGEVVESIESFEFDGPACPSIDAAKPILNERRKGGVLRHDEYDCTVEEVVDVTARVDNNYGQLSSGKVVCSYTAMVAVSQCENTKGCF